MSRLSEHHEKLTNGVGKCSVPMWSGFGTPAGFCDRDAYGPQRKREWWEPVDALRYCPGLCCPLHGGPPNPVGKADCGCVHHAEDGIPCEHDLKEMNRDK
jgi:hypothetical protein